MALRKPSLEGLVLLPSSLTPYLVEEQAVETALSEGIPPCCEPRKKLYEGQEGKGNEKRRKRGMLRWSSQVALVALDGAFWSEAMSTTIASPVQYRRNDCDPHASSKGVGGKTAGKRHGCRKRPCCFSSDLGLRISVHEGFNNF
eukprot:985267-Pyramimonas_sp.AAC.1